MSGTRGFSPIGRHIAIDHFKDGGHNAYSDDFDEIVAFLKGKISSTDILTERKFIESLPYYKQIWLKFLRRLGIS